ncbi:MAG: hypothetical protein FJ029_13125, partial [Actinobacteria bacterium]|nr:hypothetical protein [Actinomycetota bacterium]
LVLPTRFRLDFDFPGGGDADAGTCTIDVADKEQLVFAVIAKGIAMTSSGPEPVAAAEMLVATSSRCRVGGRA